jgi:CCR4-NOT transcription complex subunit 3
LYWADKIEEHQQHQNFPDESTIESTSNIGIGKNLIVEDDLKSPSVVGLISMFINL